MAGNTETDWSGLFKRIHAGEKIRHHDVEPASNCEEFLQIRKTTTGGIETLGIWCPIHGFIKTGFVGP